MVKAVGNFFIVLPRLVSTPASASLPECRTNWSAGFDAHERVASDVRSRPPSGCGRSRARARRSLCGSPRSRVAALRPYALRTRRGSAARARTPRRSRETPVGAREPSQGRRTVGKARHRPCEPRFCDVGCSHRRHPGQDGPTLRRHPRPAKYVTVSNEGSLRERNARRTSPRCLNSSGRRCRRSETQAPAARCHDDMLERSAEASHLPDAPSLRALRPPGSSTPTRTVRSSTRLLRSGSR